MLKKTNPGLAEELGANESYLKDPTLFLGETLHQYLFPH